MDASRILALRLRHQGLIGPAWPDAEAVVRAFAAMQGQDHYGAKWAVAQRCGANDAEMDRLFDAGKLLRTHLCRPTWHLVLPEDIRWILLATKDRVHQANAFIGRKQGLTPKVLNKATDLIAKALAGGKHLERDDLMAVLQRAGITTSEFRSAYFMMYAELEGVVCSGPRKGKQFTYALLDERVPATRTWTRAEALAELAIRYFSTRGPANLNDFALWSGLTVAEARKSVASVNDRFTSVSINGKDNWYPKDSGPTKADKSGKVPANTVHLLPNYDEYGIGYKDRSAFYDPSQAQLSGSRGNPVFRHLIVLNGRMVGTWDRTLTKKAVQIRSAPFTHLGSGAQKSLLAAKKRYAKFLGLALERPPD